MYSPKMASEIYGLPKVVPLSQNQIILLHQQTPPSSLRLGEFQKLGEPKGACLSCLVREKWYATHRLPKALPAQS